MVRTTRATTPPPPPKSPDRQRCIPNLRFILRVTSCSSVFICLRFLLCVLRRLRRTNWACAADCALPEGGEIYSAQASVCSARLRLAADAPRSDQTPRRECAHCVLRKKWRQVAKNLRLVGGIRARRDGRAPDLLDSAARRVQTTWTGRFRLATSMPCHFPIRGTVGPGYAQEESSRDPATASGLHLGP